MNNNECGRGHLLNNMGCFGFKAILSSSGVSIEVQSRRIFQLVFWYTHVTNDHFNSTCIKIRWGIEATCD